MKKKDPRGFTVYPARVSRMGPTLVGLLLQEDQALAHVPKILGLNALVSGDIIVTLNRSGSVAIKWFVCVGSWRQAQIAAKTLAKIILQITGVTSIRRKLRDERDVRRALAA